MHAPCDDGKGAAFPSTRDRSNAPYDMEEEEEEDADEDDDPSRADRSPNRRKTSEMVTIMEMRIRTMMIHVWSTHNQIIPVSLELGPVVILSRSMEDERFTYATCDCRRSSPTGSRPDRETHGTSRSEPGCAV